MAEQEAGVPAWVSGRVIDPEGRPLAGAELELVLAPGDDGAPVDRGPTH